MTRVGPTRKRTTPGSGKSPRRAVRALAVALSMMGLTVLAACSTEHSGAEHNDAGAASESTVASSAAEAPDASPDDVMFAQMMIPHHRQAVLMAELAESRASDPMIVELATEILAAQQPEIDQMTSWLVEWGAEVPEPGADAGAHAGHGMAGMLTDEQLADLEAADGPAFDRLFAEGMIEHHAGAIEMAQAVTGSADTRVATLADAIIATQQREIDQLQAYLDGAATE